MMPGCQDMTKATISIVQYIYRYSISITRILESGIAFYPMKHNISPIVLIYLHPAAIAARATQYYITKGLLQ